MMTDSQTNTVSEILSKAINYYKSKEYERAKNEFKSVLRNDSKNEEALQYLGTIAWLDSDFEIALTYYLQVVEISPNTVNALYNLGITYQKLGKLDDAIEFIEKAIKVNPNEKMLFIHASLAKSLGRHQTVSLKDYQRVLEFNPTSINALGNSGRLYEDLKQYDKALEMYNKITKLAPEKGMAYYDKAIVYETIKDYNKALENIEKALILYQTNPDGLPNKQGLLSKKEDILRKLNKYTEAIECLQDGLVKHSETGEDYNNAIVLKGMNDFQATDQIYTILDNRYGKRGEDWILVKQTLDNNKQGVFDKMEIKLNSGEEKTLYFNITDTIGKL